MKVHTQLITLAVGLLTLVGGAAAQTGDGGLEARVPFGFSAGGAALAPGTYTLQRQASGVILVRGIRSGAFLATESSVESKRQGVTRLVFHRYGNQYFLRQVWFAGTRGYALPQTRAERETASRAGKLASAPVVVVVAAHS
jgi:hypothetical protein